MLTFKGEILIAPHEKLRRRADEISPDKVDSAFLQLMKEVIDEKQAAGLAANQIGFNRRVIMIKDGEMYRWHINPKILDYSVDISYDLESCLSIPDGHGSYRVFRVPRYDCIHLTDSLDVGVIHRYSGFLARVVQHEIDHLNGILISDFGHSEVKVC